jgi:hypothetical protein
MDIWPQQNEAELSVPSRTPQSSKAAEPQREETPGKKHTPQGCLKD